MLYNLPNGKTIYLTIEEYLNLTDDDIQYLISIKAGNSFNPFHKSALDNNSKGKANQQINTDYLPDDLKEDDISYDHDYLDENDESYDQDFDFMDPIDI